MITVFLSSRETQTKTNLMPTVVCVFMMCTCERIDMNNQETERDVYCVLCMCCKLVDVFYSLTH